MALFIVSGHEINAEVRIFDSDDEVLKCLIETNIRQRGIGNTNPVKLGRCLKELERIYGIQQGRRTDLETFPNNSVMSQEDLANQLGVSVDTIQNYKQLADMIPEMQDLVETGIVTPTTARAIVKQLPEFQQKELAEQLSADNQKKTQKKVQELINRIKELENRDNVIIQSRGIFSGSFFVSRIQKTPYPNFLSILRFGSG